MVADEPYPFRKPLKFVQKTVGNATSQILKIKLSFQVIAFFAIMYLHN